MAQLQLATLQLAERSNSVCETVATSDQGDLVVESNKVKWFKSGRLFRSISFDDQEVIYASFVSFDSMGPSDEYHVSTVIVLKDSIHIYNEFRGTTVLWLPFVVTNALQFAKGLILQRDTRRSGKSLNGPRFLTLIDPLMDFGLVVTTDLSSISPSECLVSVARSSNSSLYLTHSPTEGRFVIYHSRQLTHSKKYSKTSRHSSTRRRSSSIFPRSEDQLSDNDMSTNLENTLAYSRGEKAIALDRMSSGGDAGNDGEYTNYDFSSLRKDIMLTEVKVIDSEPVQMSDVVAQQLSFFEREAIAIFNRKTNVLQVHMFVKASGPVERPQPIDAVEYQVKDLITSTDCSSVEGCNLLVRDANDRVVLLNPFVGVSVPLDIGCNGSEKLSWSGTNRVQCGSAEKLLVLEPKTSLMNNCLNLLSIFFDGNSYEILRLRWALAYSQFYGDELTAFTTVVASVVSEFSPLAVPDQASDDSQITFESSVWDWVAEGASKTAPAFTKKVLQVAHELVVSLPIDSSIERVTYMTLALHIFREDRKLDISCSEDVKWLGELMGQLVTSLKWPDSWCQYYGVDVNQGEIFVPPLADPPNLLASLAALCYKVDTDYVCLSALVGGESTVDEELTPRTQVAIKAFELLSMDLPTAEGFIHLLIEAGFTKQMLARFPEGVAIPILNVVHICKSESPISSDPAFLEIIDRDDLARMAQGIEHVSLKPTSSSGAAREIQGILASLNNPESTSAWDEQVEADRVAVARQVFSSDRRFYEASKLLQTSKVQSTTLVIPPDCNEHEALTLQKEVAKTIAMRTFTVPLGRSSLFFSARVPLTTERFPIPKLNFNVLLRPDNVTVPLDKSLLSEDSTAWGYFHNGVSSGLSVSRGARDISGNWVAFNRPQQLNAQHAGFLLGLGLNGHMKNVEEWHIFNYLGPKHTLTSIGLLLGMSVSLMGTMDAKLTKVLSVHIGALLPVGSNDLNVGGSMQTAGLVGIGFLYLGSQHRRMTEMLAGEIGRDATDGDVILDEGYRLGAGISLGLINLGEGEEFSKGSTTSKLVSLATPIRDIQNPNFLDSPTSGAIYALMLIFMKTNNQGIASKLAPPDSEPMLEYVRPDLLLLRALAANIIMWDQIGSSVSWVEGQISAFLRRKYTLKSIKTLNSDMLSYMNIIAGNCFALALKHASTANEHAKSTLLHYLDEFMRLATLPTETHDQKLTQLGVINTQDCLALSLAIVMVGTGDLDTFRRLRILHGRAGSEVPYGSFMATHLAMGTLFLGGGQFAFSRSNLAIASLLIAFYPLFPSSMQDNRSHLQALRHFWVLAAEPRCLIVRNINNGQSCAESVTVTLKDGPPIVCQAPCLLPELDTIKALSINAPHVLPVHIDFEESPAYLESFKKTQTIYVKNVSDETSHIPAGVALRSDSDHFEVNHDTLSGKLLKLQVFQKSANRDLALFSNHTASPAHVGSLSPLLADMQYTLELTASNPTLFDDMWNLRLLIAHYSGIDSSQAAFLPPVCVEKLKLLLRGARAKMVS
ncbi:Negative regulator of mitosis [Yarrowia sp. E02]|nr:Negative regulator of mitosis [Yarrowia sp. E02]